MSVGVIDVREWQTTVDFATGEKVEATGELVGLAKKLIANRYYPGDTDRKGIRWVTDTALDLVTAYQPDFLFLSYAQPYFYSLYREYREEEWEEICSSIFTEIERLVIQTEYVPVVVGLGGMVPVKGFVDLNDLDGLGVATNWSFQYAGLYGPSIADLDLLTAHPHVERVVSKAEFIQLFRGMKNFIARLPDYLLVAKEGYTFRGFSTTARKIYRIPAKNFHIPVYTSLGKLRSIVDIHSLVSQAIPRQKVALILVEGVGPENFASPYQLVENREYWFTYENSLDQYLAIGTGTHFQYGEFPPVYLRDDAEDEKYPFSGGFTVLPQQTLGRKKGIKSGAVGSRGIVTHLTAGADITIECFARQLYNFGTMAIINDTK